MDVDYATTIIQALLQVLTSYGRRCFSHSHVLIPIPMHFIPIPILFPSMADLIPIPMGIPWDPSLPHSHAHLQTVKTVSHGNLQLHRFTTSENTAKSLRGLLV